MRIPLTEIPVGYNLRGKTVVFTRTDLSVPPRWFDDGCYIEGDGAFVGWETKDVNVVTGGGQPYACIYRFNTGWISEEDIRFTFLSDAPIIVSANTLFPHENDYWGFDYAYVID